MGTTVSTSALVLECISGNDLDRSIELPAGQMVVLGAETAENRIVIKELQEQGGAILIAAFSDHLQLDATDCPLPVRINGHIITRHALREGDRLLIGNSVWRMRLPAAPAPANAVTSIRKGFDSFIGLEELKDFNLATIFSQVFKKHSLAEMEDQLTTGTERSTPELGSLDIAWAKPWLFSRMLVISVALVVLLIISYRSFQNINLIPGLMFIGSFAVPVSTLIFFLEMNTPRNISIFMVMAMAFLGGVTSLFVALLFFDWFQSLSELMGASAAGIVEELAKLLVVVLIAGRFVRYRWVLNGLLFGAAIGMGFAAFESAGYAYRSSAVFEEMVDNIVLRGLLSPFMHIVWTANAAAALWLVKGARKFQWSMLGDMRFLRVLFSSMALHMIWNAEFSILAIPVFYDIKFLLLGIIGWVICFRLVQVGLGQLNEARKNLE